MCNDRSVRLSQIYYITSFKLNRLWTQASKLCKNKSYNIYSETMAIASNIHSVEKLTDENYETWRFTMKSDLICHDLWEYVNRSEIKTEANSVPWSTKNQKTFALILLNLSKNQLSHVKKAKTSKEA